MFAVYITVLPEMYIIAIDKHIITVLYTGKIIYEYNCKVPWKVVYPGAPAGSRRPWVEVLVWGGD